MRNRTPWMVVGCCAGLVPFLGGCGDWFRSERDSAGGNLSTEATCPVDVPLGDLPMAASWPPGPEHGWPDDGTTAGCLLARKGRLAIIEIDAIVRDYGNPEGKYPWQVTVWRLRVHEVLRGGPLPEVVYAYNYTGKYPHDPERRYRHPSAKWRVGWRGLGLLRGEGRDMVRVTAHSRSGEPLNEPARLLTFGIRPFVEGSETLLDVSDDDEFVHLYGADTIELSDLLDLVDGVDPESCYKLEYYRACAYCDTAQRCDLAGTDPWPCRCISGYPDCKDLPPEDPLRSCLYDPSAQAD